MNFSIHLPDDLAVEVAKLAKKNKKTRNALISEAVRDFVKGHIHKNWPDEVFKLVGMEPNLESFESHRRELRKLSEITFK